MKYPIILILSLIISQFVNAQVQQRTICIQKDGKLLEAPYNYNTATGVKSAMVRGVEVPMSFAYKTDSVYAKNYDFYKNNEAITFNGKQYAKYGLPRIMGTNELEKAGTYIKANIFAAKGDKDYEVIYLFIQPGCEFQPYTISSGKK